MMDRGTATQCRARASLSNARNNDRYSLDFYLDIDECSVSSKSCDSDEVCYNTEGSYKCRTKYCLDGEANRNCVKSKRPIQ